MKTIKIPIAFFDKMPRKAGALEFGIIVDWAKVDWAKIKKDNKKAALNLNHILAQQDSREGVGL